jgi:formate dehydrogenase iron-sulfur subunit
MQLNRKEFLKLSATGTGLALLLGSLDFRKVLGQGSDIPADAKAVLNDPTKCVGCRACQAACKNWNKLPPDTEHGEEIYDNAKELSAITWTLIKYKESEGLTDEEWIFCRYQCMHCTDASCLEVCPTGAIERQGVSVVIDQEWCIGCGYCVQACPYSVPHKDHELGTAKKCTFCIDRTTNDMIPACAEACPAGAIKYGDRDELVAEGQERVQALVAEGNSDAELYGVSELGGLNALYVLPTAPAFFDLPENPQAATKNTWAQWLGGLLTAAAVVAVPFWWIFKRKSAAEDVAQTS